MNPSPVHARSPTPSRYYATNRHFYEWGVRYEIVLPLTADPDQRFHSRADDLEGHPSNKFRTHKPSHSLFKFEMPSKDAEDTPAKLCIQFQGLLQGLAKRLRPGFAAVACHFYLSLPAAFTQPGQILLADPCTLKTRIMD